MRSDVFGVGFIFHVVEEIGIERPFLVVRDELGIFIYPGVAIFDFVDLLGRHRFQLLEEIDSPCRVADHLVSAGLFCKRRRVYQAVYVVLLVRLHLPRKCIYNNVKSIKV